MKKLLLSLGAIASVAAPVAAVVACGSTTPDAGTISTDTNSSKTTAQLKAVKAADVKDVTTFNTKLGLTIDTTTLSTASPVITWNPTSLKLTIVTTTGAAGEEVKVTTVYNVISKDAHAHAVGTKTIASTLTKAELDNIDQAGLADKNPIQVNTLFGLAANSVATSGNDLIWDKATSTLKANAQGNKFNYVITPKAAAVVDGYENATKTVTVTITVEANDFQNHVAGEAAQAIQAIMAGKDISDIEHVTISIKDGTTVVTNTADVEEVSKSTDADIKARQNLNAAINVASEADAKDVSVKHDMSLDASDYSTKMVERINAVTSTTFDFNFANKLIEALGNATKFVDAENIAPVFAPAYAFSTTAAPKKVKAEMLGMLSLNAFGTFDDDIKAALTIQINKITD